MSFAITMTVTADGEVTVTAIDQAGGCPYQVAHKPGGDMRNTDNSLAARRIERGITMRSGAEWHSLAPCIRKAAVEIMLCLPPAEYFDDDGRPNLDIVTTGHKVDT